jgi:hypothetical protein
MKRHLGGCFLMRKTVLVKSNSLIECLQFLFEIDIPYFEIWFQIVI